MKLLNTGAGLIGSKFFGRPFYVRYHISYRCNYRCRMCRLHTHAADYSELSIDQVRLVADKLARLGSRHVVITGGEPFLRPDLPEVVEIFARRGFSVRIQTNGGPQVTREKLAAAAARGLRDLSVSIDTLEGGLQDDICQGKDVVENALRTLSLSAEILPGGMSLANIVASRFNFEKLPDLVEHFHRLGIYSYITPVMISTNGEGSESYLFRSDDGRFLPESLDAGVRERVIARLKDLRRRGAGLTNSTRYLEDYRRYLASGKCEWKCEAGTLCLDVRPDGRVSVCKEKPPVGNILDEGFAEFYRSPGFRKTARETADSCTGCFYGEYREPQYAVRDVSVFLEWVRDWISTFHRGMRWDRAKNNGNADRDE